MILEYTEWIVNDLLVNPIFVLVDSYLFNAVKRVWIN